MSVSLVEETGAIYETVMKIIPKLFNWFVWEDSMWFTVNDGLSGIACE